MAKRKVQVTLEQSQYEDLARVAERQGKKLAAVVRESIVRYCLEPESERAKRKALEDLFTTEAPVPRDYALWKREYSRLKTEGDSPKRPSRATRRRGK